MMVGDTSMDGPGLEEQLQQQGLSIDKHEHGWIIFLRPLPNDEFWETFLDNPGREFMVKDKIKRLLEKITSYPWGEEQAYLVQFWAPEQQQQCLYLTTYNQPFAVGRIHHQRVVYGYRGRCMGHRYRVDDGADEGELGAVGRVYRNKRPESTPDLRLYSTNEFPFRDDADACGLRSYWALPLFDTDVTQKFYGVIEVLCSDGDGHMLTTRIMRSLEILLTIQQNYMKAAQLRTTHLNLRAQLRTTHLNLRESIIKDADSEIIEMLQLATRVIPQLQMAHVWIPCHECHYTNNISSCMELADPIVADGNVWDSIRDIGNHGMRRYYEACEFHHLQIGEHTNATASTVTSFGNKPRICRNVCDFSIYDNPLVHYAQKAMLSYCFAVRLRSSNNNRRDFKVVQFFLQCNSREDEFFKSCFPLLLRIMEMKLKKYKFAYEGELGEELEVEVVSAFSALRFETIKYKHHRSKEINSMLETKRCNKLYPPSDFTKYLKKADLHYSQPSGDRHEHRWVFWSHALEKIRQDEPSLVSDIIQDRIKYLMSKTANQQVLRHSAVGQFWAPKWDGDTDRCYLEASEQPFFLHTLYKDLAYFRKQCMGHRYYVDGAMKEDKLGPPGRVFLNGHPEITPDLRLYSPTEFPFRDHAARCGLTSYLALPIFKLNEPKCVGVLELLGFFNFTLNYDVGKDLEEANLSSTHINCKPGLLTSPLSGNNGERWELALTEIRQACEQFATIPQLYMVEVWVPFNECPCNNNANFCMELVQTTEREVELDPRSPQVQHVKIGKGIAGMALACESKSCFCRNSCEFSIADQPLAYDAWRPRLDVCFTICLQSHYTGDLVYLLHFYLNGTCREYKYFKIFLCLLLQKMKLAFKSFKMASGQEIGEKLVIEVIEFSQVNVLDFSVSDQPEDLPVIFKFVNCRTQKYHKEKQVQFAEAVAQEETGQCSNVAPNLKKKDAAAEETKGAKRKTSSNLTFEMLKPYFGRKMKDVENIVGAHRSTIKRVCRANGMKGWPWNENHKNNISIFMKESASENISNFPASHMAAPHTDSQSSRGPIVESHVDLVVIKAKYEDDTIRVQLCRSAGLEKLLNEVGRRLKLSVGSFKLKYVDEDNDEILLACDDDLQQCLKSQIAMDKPYIQVLVKLI